MNKFYNWLWAEQNNLVAKCFFWNMVGSFTLALGTMVLTIGVNRIAGDYSGGDFAMSLAVGQLMSTIGYFETRTYQVTDTHKAFQFSDYYITRFVTDVIMILSSVGYIFIKGYTFEKAILVFLLCIYKMIDTFADVFEGEFQQNERLDISGKSLTLRTVLSIIAILVCLSISHNLYFSMFGGIIVALIVVYFTNYRIVERFTTVKVNVNLQNIWRIILECLPLFISSFMMTYILNASRYAVESCMPSNIQSKYTAIFLPVSTINLLIGFIFKPMLTNLARKWNNGRYKEFLIVIIYIFLGIVVVTVVTLLGAYLLGIPVLSLLYKTSLDGFKFSLLILLVGGGINSANVILYYALSVMRKQKSILLAYGITFLSSLLIPNYLTQQSGVQGAAYSFVIVMAILLFVSIFVFAFFFIKRDKFMQENG